MSRPHNQRPTPCVHRQRETGFTLIELVISMTISLVVLLAMVKLFNNTSRSNDQLQRAGDVTENGRSAAQLLAEDISHAGYLGGYIPTFDDLTYTDIPLDVPSAIVNPCKAMDTWTSADYVNATGIVIDVRTAVPTGTGCLNGSGLSSLAGSDVLIVRHADTCAIGDTGCAAFATGTPYVQVSHCPNETLATAQGSSAANKITLSATASTTNDAYVGGLIRLTGGAGKGQVRRIAAYVGSTTQEATVDADWSPVPDATTQYSLPVVISTAANAPLRPRTCVASPPTTTVTERRRFVAHMYYVANQTRDGQVIPTLMRSDLGPDGSGGIVFGEPVAVVYGVEAFHVVVGIDNKAKGGGAVNYAAAVTWADALNLITATNRGDGVPDSFVHCTACTATDFLNVTAAKIYVLARSRDTTRGYTNSKSYCLGETSDGTCAAGDSIAAKNDGVPRRVFQTSARLVNVASRRETPP